MARASISAYSATQTSNTLITDDSTDISIAEGFAAANINNAIRTMMTHLADAYAGDAAYDSVTDTITAGTTQTQAGAVALTTTINRISVVGTSGDSVKLPTAVAGLQVLIINDDSAQTVKVWPNTSDTINGGSANAVDGNQIASGAARLYIATSATAWYTALNDLGTIPLGVTSGGTGAATFTDGGILLGSGTGAITATAVLTDGQVLVGDGSGDPVAESGATLRTSLGLGTGDTPEFNGIDLDGGELKLDADGNTSLTSDTGDQIDIKIAGADDFQFTANTFTALSGSTIAIASGATIANSGTATGFSASTLAAATTVGDGTAEDTKIVFDGNAQDYYIGLDDTDDDLKIGLGSTVGTTAHIVIDEAGAVTMPLQPALLAVSDAVNDVTGNGDAYTPAAFASAEVFDRNSDFDGTGTFTAPVTGVYAVGVTAQLGGMTSSETRARAICVASNRSIDLFDVHGFNVSQPDPKMTLTGYTLVDADASDTIVITIFVFNGSKVVDWKANSTLSIHLVA